jgi:hypothetical protein
MAPRLFGTDAGASNPALFTAAAGLTEMAGWMAHDAGRDASAKRHFGRALALVQVGGDQQLTAHILGSMSHLASHLGAPDEAVTLARRGQAALHAGPANPALEARMLALEPGESPARSQPTPQNALASCCAPNGPSLAPPPHWSRPG